MCGRFALDIDEKTLRAQLNATLVEPLPNNFNVAPTENCLVVTANNEQRLAHTMQWGIHPWYNPKQLLINARIESIKEKSAFKQAFVQRRCVLVISGFFEWQHHKSFKNKTIKQPFFMQREDVQLMAVAAIWEKSKEASALPSCCLITTSANSSVDALHDRMPLILQEQHLNAWLQKGAVNENHLETILKEAHSLRLKAHAVTPEMNKNSYKAANSITPI